MFLPAKRLLTALIIGSTRSAGAERRCLVRIHSTLRKWDKNVMPFQGNCCSSGRIDGADVLIYGAMLLLKRKYPMMYLETPPRLIETEVFSAMPEHHRRKGVRTDWADANRPGQPTDCFIEGPSFDADGNLYIVDIPFGRIFRISPDGQWSLVVEYDGWPNGLKIHPRRAHLRRRLHARHHGARCKAGRCGRCSRRAIRNRSRAATICISLPMATSILPTRDRPGCTIRPGGFFG